VAEREDAPTSTRSVPSAFEAANRVRKLLFASVPGFLQQTRRKRSETVSGDVRFEKVTIKGDTPRENRDGVAVIRGGRCVAVLPEAARLDRALSQPLEDIEYIANNLGQVLGREPTHNEREFWRAVLDFRRSQSQRS